MISFLVWAIGPHWPHKMDLESVSLKLFEINYSVHRFFQGRLESQGFLCENFNFTLVPFLLHLLVFSLLVDLRVILTSF